jgi:hypothetical protein
MGIPPLFFFFYYTCPARVMQVFSEIIWHSKDLLKLTEKDLKKIPNPYTIEHRKNQKEK